MFRTISVRAMCATCPVRSRALNRRAVFGADLDSAIAMNLLAKISETRRARDLSRRVTVSQRSAAETARASDKTLSTSDCNVDSVPGVPEPRSKPRYARFIFTVRSGNQFRSHGCQNSNH